MIKVQLRNVAIENLTRITNELGINFISPYGSEIDFLKDNVLGFLPNYGSPNGMIICATSAPEYFTDHNVSTWAKKFGIFFTFINIDKLLKIGANDFLNMIDDWGKFH